jgi:uncharacterized membrane protein YccC
MKLRQKITIFLWGTVVGVLAALPAAFTIVEYGP